MKVLQELNVIIKILFNLVLNLISYILVRLIVNKKLALWQKFW